MVLRSSPLGGVGGAEEEEEEEEGMEAVDTGPLLRVGGGGNPGSYTLPSLGVGAYDIAGISLVIPLLRFPILALKVQDRNVPLSTQFSFQGGGLYAVIAA